MAGRLYNEKQVGEILRRASATQSKESAVNGITLEELKQVGVELGFDPAQIELAAQEVRPETHSRSGFLNGKIQLDQTVDGEIGAEGWLDMVATTQRHFRKAGTINQRSSNYDWIGTEEAGSLSLNVNVRNGKTRIRIQSSQWMGIVFPMLFGPILALFATLATLKHGSPEAALIAIASIGAVMFTIISRTKKNHLEMVNDLMEHLVADVEADVADRPKQVGAGLRAQPDMPTPIGRQVQTNA